MRGAQNDQVNGKQFWDDLRKYLLAPETDRSMMPSMEYWAPFILEKNRKGDMVKISRPETMSGKIRHLEKFLSWMKLSLR